MAKQAKRKSVYFLYCFLGTFFCELLAILQKVLTGRQNGFKPSKPSGEFARNEILEILSCSAFFSPVKQFMELNKFGLWNDRNRFELRGCRITDLNKIS